MTRKKKNPKEEKEARPRESELHPDIRKSVWVIFFLALAILFILAGTGEAGPFGAGFYNVFDKLFGWGYYFLPIVSFLIAFSFIAPERKKIWGATLLSAVIFVLAGLGFIDIISPGAGGLSGNVVGALKTPFGTPASLLITFAALAASFLIILNRPVSLKKIFSKKESETGEIEMEDHIEVSLPAEPVQLSQGKPEKTKVVEQREEDFKMPKVQPMKNYVPPPLNLLVSTVEKPTSGDLRANANVIKRTLDSFGIPVEMGEINVGPTVTRYTLKPAEGVKLSRITALSQDLSLALAAHPIRIEAPIPGKSLVGIEVPNKMAAVVRLGSLLLYPDFHKNSNLSFALGRNVSGEPVFADIEKMPHLLIAGATGSGKSIMIHSLLISLLYRNSPEMLRLIMIDPKRVELSIYDGIPQLLTPVITDNKKSIGALRWAIQEMERRYQILLEAGARDIKSYNKNKTLMPFIVIVIDELADLMASFGREVEGSIIRLAQMARATGIHLVVSTQRPSVEVITGLIKANITSRVALQVASQVDSRTILDTAGAEKLLGSGDLLFVSAELSKPKRLQGAYITEEEIKKVIGFIKKNNEPVEEGEVEVFAETNGNGNGRISIDDYTASHDDDELYGEAVEVVKIAGKASASLLQRRLKVGYARAARLLDIMEERGVVGPGEGAKPREVYLDQE
ncbi:MAG: Cell division FtsK/SpoIIIE [Candidatus Jorgensenbacteria bacterium GW2011_GWA1_48_11]|uniref:Cell division FtsK/SpoIIIE n=1 Tax=Candidatus Jorgensenbacteria bacterium GW2011_GWA1_48_11 TaxID=1618660 RepID=A0A0G1WMS7_9BACT|nr:MAG: Cell division FtsK/SpoIIIE [Candidatus Jorgensenbacteria bacterium GW2011_GWA1_48_11]KKW12115.1 MAG: Cell division FtsK/SpoIIIE [Candidatus Jorgensenbacteria bacterium GW2011_GWB1_49_9]